MVAAITVILQVCSDCAGGGSRRREFVGDRRRVQKGNGDRVLAGGAPGSIPLACGRKR